MKRFFLLPLILFILSPAFLHAEGSKEVWVSGHETNFFHCTDFIGKCNDGNGDRLSFAVYGCSDDYRLCFVTNSPNEAVYLGFQNGSMYNVVFRIKDLAGNIVYTERSVPGAGYGFIPSINNAWIGPNQIYGSTSGGYDALSFRDLRIGLTYPMTYYLEFNIPAADDFTMELIDVTVADTSIAGSYVAKPGRLYSKAWQYTEGMQNCSATTYIYSNDSIITSCQFNDMNGGTWIQFCNQNGCGTSGIFENDRKSVGYQVLLPQYKIFVNPPDPAVFPAAVTLGQIVPPDPWGERFCNNGHIIFHVNVSKAGNAKITLSFGAPYLDRELTQAVVTGENLFDWDGLDGNGVPVPNNVNVSFTVTYINGLTNLPFYDVEGNTNGFVIGIVSPPGATPLVFWDDTGVGGGSNLTGCLSPPGCHDWSGSGGGFGNLKTINTWWYNVSTSTAYPAIAEWRLPQTLVFNQPPQSLCAGTSNLLFSVTADPNTDAYHWFYTGTGATIVQGNPAFTWVQVSFAANATSGNLAVYGTNSNCSANGDTSFLAITIKPVPSTALPYSKSICSGQNVNFPLVSTPAGALFSWPAPTCSANIALPWPPAGNNATLINDAISLTDLNPGTVTYNVTPTLNGCTGSAQPITIDVNPLPDITATPSTPAYCSGSTTNIALSSTVPGAVFTWTVDDNVNVNGDLPGPFTNNPIAQTLTINAGIYTPQNVNYHISAASGACVNPVITDVTVTVHPIPDVSNVPMSTQLCSGNSTNVPLLSNVNPGTTFTWTFTDNPDVSGETNSPAPTTTFIQTLTNATFDPETVNYQITPTSQFGCVGLPQTFLVNIVTTPDIYFVPPSDSICSGTACNIGIFSNNTSATFTWTTSPAPNPPVFYGWADGSGSLIQQTIYNTSNIPQQVVYTATPTAAGCPPGPPGNFILTVIPIPAITNSASSAICSGAFTNIAPLSDVNPATFTWTSSVTGGSVTGNGSGGPVPPPPIQDQLINTAFTTGTVNYQVTPTAYGCTGNASPFDVTVWPVANVIFTPNGQQVCAGGTTNISLSSDVLLPAPSYSWTAAYGGTASGPLSGNGTPISETLTNPGPLPGTATFTVTPSVNGCPGTQNSVVVNVNPLPTVTFTPCFDLVVSLNAQSITLKGGSPLSGTYSGAGVAAGIFDPGVAGAGNHVLSYTYINNWLCSSFATAIINVVSLPPFTCGTNLLDVRDNQSYATILLGGRCWFAQNLNYGGTIASALMQLDNCAPEKYCFGDNLANCASSGGMYQWDEMMQYTALNGAQGFCPPEWHVATEADWQSLFAFYTSPGFAGSPLKYTGFSGFDAFLSGMRFNNVTWNFNGFAAMFWTSDSHGNRKAWAHGMNEYNPSVSLYPSHRNNAFFVRCVKD